MKYPVLPEENGLKIKPENMEIEKLYHCLYKEKLFLFFKDQGESLNCFEIEEKELVDKVKNCSNENEIESILENYASKEHINH